MVTWRILGGMNEIILITDKYPYEYGEATFIEPEIEFLRNSYNITLLSKSSSKDLKTEIPDVDIFRCSTKILKRECLQYGFFVLKNPIFYKEMIKSLNKGNSVLKSLRVIFPSLINEIKLRNMLSDIVEHKTSNNILIYSYWFNYSVLSAINLKKKSKKQIKVISRIHGYDLYDERHVLGYQPFQDIALLDLDRVIFTCETAKKYYLNRHEERRQDQFFCGYMGVKKRKKVNIQKTTPFTLVSCSNLIPLKRVHLIIEALGILEDIDIQWIHFGDGILKDSLYEQAHLELSPKKNVHYNFCGNVKNTDILNLYASGQVNCFISTSETEGMPMSIIEALAHGIPVIATNVGGIHEQINNNGILLDKNPTRESVAEAIRYMYNLSITDQRRLGSNSYQLWKQFFDLDYNLEILGRELQKIMREE